MNTPKNPDRRKFIKTSAYAGMGFTLGFQLISCSKAETGQKTFSPNVWLSLSPDNRAVIQISKAEMGQGVITAIPLIIAEELELDWSQISVELAEASEKFGSMYTGGSSSIRSLWKPLREAGAAAKEMLIEAGALNWQVDKSDCYASQGRVYNRASGKSFSFGELCQAASKLPVPTQPTLKPDDKLTILGKEITNINLLEKINGSAIYGTDIDMENLKYAAIKHAPVFNSKPLSVNKSTAAQTTGVHGIIELDSAVVVVADSYWLAQKTLDALDIKWQETAELLISSEQITEDFSQQLDKPGELVREAGTATDTSGLTAYTADYQCAFQAHAPMETINCTVHIHDQGCDVWAPTQDALNALSTATKAYKSNIGYWSSKILKKLGIPGDVRVFPTLIGGAFGRRLHQDYVTEAVQIASHFDFPVKMIWSREEDIQHDFFRPYTMHRVQAYIDKQGKISNWKHQAIGASRGRVAGSSALDFPYDIPHKSLYFTKMDHGVPIGYWRSVSHSHNVFVIEAFIDELAAHTHQDPLNFRLGMLEENPRARQLLKTAAKFAQWDEKISAGRFLGIALCYCFESYIAIITEVETSGEDFTVREIFCAVDCGIIIDPDSVRAQLEGGIIFGLGAAIKHAIHIHEGRTKESNFHDYQLPEMGEIPPINIHLAKNDHKPGGIGEVGVPAIAPSIANALFMANGKRVRKLPLRAV